MSLPDFSAQAERYQRQVAPAYLQQLADSLGLSIESLRRLQVGANGAGFTFPMSAPDGQIIGLRMRYRNGRKSSQKGSRQGLFIPTGLSAKGLLLICEGPTDAATALDLGFAAVGRPSCNTGGRMLARLARRRLVAIIGDNDPVGRRGAESLATELILHCPDVRIVYPPENTKDLRQWKATGLTGIRLKEQIETTNSIRLTITHTTREGRG